ncbi:SusC/RagA family TonB-linked outer membrane protein [Sphingobacterium yanglingense]|uniref:TonB-linked SusC/RagA family outer membrane protein n=1 Tax=Sphingobacterium yanglingense TaxID=1437280 RepID=A0A4R6WBG2_9SPHI|nr:SusC/RagA family TonB-linked outer membrane protein [Sphingobacterium yanglingense]TDQ76728.1 TonB-linked SusC/RagA family outer membrane protein [Sphingobacterium yanglingense]
MSKFYLKCCSLSALMLLCISMVFAQQSVTGIVSDASGPLKGVSISVKGTNKATQSDSQGAYSIQVETGQTLRFSMIGYISQEIIASSAKTINVSLVNQEGALDEVVVTAMGMKREKKSLGYSFQEVKSEQLMDAKENNIANALVGKVSGLQVIKGSSGPASSTKITLRGNNSLTGDNQPLIVVDGVPMNNFIGSKTSSGAANNDFWNPGTDMGNGLGDINPEDIESMSVLKSGAASALYGSRAGNGAIIITTKSGKAQKGTGITVSSTLGLERLFMFPKLQNSFAQGADGTFDKINANSWGPAMNGNDLKAYDNIDNFFKTGVNHTQNISFQQKVGNTNIYSSATYLNDQSKIPGSSLERLNLMTRANSTFGANDRWSTDVKVQYMNNNATNRPTAGQNNGNAYNTLFTLPRSLNILDYKNTLTPTGKMNWFGNSNSMNPYWLSEYQINNDIRNRYLMNATVKYKITDWLDAEARFGMDSYATRFDNRTYGGSPLAATGKYSNGKSDFSERNYTIALHAHKDQLGDSKWGVSGSVFGQIMKNTDSYLSIDAGELEVPNFFHVENGKGRAGLNQLYSEKQINSLYAMGELNYDGYWFLTVTGREDWSSTLLDPFFYPGVSTSLVLSDMIRKNGGNLPSFLSFLKLRGSYAMVGNDSKPYQLYNSYAIGKDPNGTTTSTYDEIKYNRNLKNELIKSLEFGFDARFLNNRLGLDFAWYNNNATNQLLEIPMDPMSGFRAEVINAGKIQNTGFEITLDAQILQKDNGGLNWNTSINFSKNTNKVIKLTDEVTTYKLGGFDNLEVNGHAGELYGNIYGTKYLRVEDSSSPYFGQRILKDGLPQATDVVLLGNQAPKALIGWINSFNYKNIGLSFQVDGRFGGKFFSGTQVNLQRAGVADITAPGGKREDFVVQGVTKDGNGYKENTTSVTHQQYWNQVTNTGNLGISEENLYNATNIRLRNITLSYNVPSSILNSKVLQRAKVGFTVNNAWMIKSYANGIDPESVFSIGTNATGFENFSTPTSRSFLFNLTLGF